MRRTLLPLALLVIAAPALAGPVEGEPSMPDALRRAVASTWTAPEPGKATLKASRDIVVDHRRRTLIVLATPAKLRKVVTMLQRIVADTQPAVTLPSNAPKPGPKPAGDKQTFNYQGVQLITVIKQLTKDLGMNLIVRGPPPRAPITMVFTNVTARDLLKLLLDVYNLNYQMSPNGETLVVFGGTMHRVLESFSVPAKVPVPLEEIAAALQTSILDVDEPGMYGEEYGGGAGGGASGGVSGGGGAGGAGWPPSSVPGGLPATPPGMPPSPPLPDGGGAGPLPPPPPPPLAPSTATPSPEAP